MYLSPLGWSGLPKAFLSRRAMSCCSMFEHPQAAAPIAVAFARHHPIDAVIGVDDVTAVAAAAVAEAVGLPHNSVASVTAARNKRQMRELLSGQGIPVPRHKVFSLDGDPRDFAKQVDYPCVVKPLILSASCGVIRANDEEEFRGAFRRVGTLLNNLGLVARDEQARWILVEDFVPGIEVALEGLLTKGALQPLAMFDKPDPLDGPFFEETIYVTPSRLPSDCNRTSSPVQIEQRRRSDYGKDRCMGNSASMRTACGSLSWRHERSVGAAPEHWTFPQACRSKN